MPVRISALQRPLARLVGLAIPAVREMLDIWSQFSQPFTIDSLAFEQQLGPLPPTPHHAAIEATVGWFAGQRRRPPLKHGSGLNSPAAT